MTTWHKVGKIQTLPERTIHPVRVAGDDWILLREGDQVQAFRDLCSHQDVRLSEYGLIDGDTLVCLAHGARFACADGAPRSWPAKIGLETIAVKIMDGDVFLNPQLRS